MISDKAVAATNDCLRLMAEAKQTLVSADGIGSELLPAIIAWSGDQIIGYAILQNPFATGKMIHTSLTIASRLMRVGWHADALAITMEGYVQEASPFTQDYDGPSLASQFAMDTSIREALWVAYADVDGHRCMGVACFHQDVGRVVRFDDPTFSRNDQLEDFKESGTIPFIVTDALSSMEPMEVPKSLSIELCRKRMAVEIHQLGFSVYLDHDDESWISIYDDDDEELIIPDFPPE